MANIRKSFNFRNGVQIDNNKFVVNANGLVGIGTSVPLAPNKLDVHGDARITGLATVNNVSVSEGLEVSGITTVGFITASSGRVSGVLTVAQLSVGNNTVNNLIGYGFTTFISDNAGVGLHTTSKIGINTSTSPGASDSELTVTGDVEITGITTTQSLVTQSLRVNGIATATTFDGNLNASNLSTGTIPSARFPAALPAISGAALTSLNGSNITSGTIDAARVATLNQNTTGTAAGLTGTPNVTLGITTTGLFSATSVGIGTATPANTFQQRATGATELQVTSDTASASVTVGRESGTANTNNAEFRYGGAGGFPYSTPQSLDLINYGTGNFNYYLSANNSSAAVGDYIWHKGSNNDQLMALTKDGNLGIGITNPTQKLNVQGISTFTGAAHFDSTVTIGGNLSATFVGDVKNSSNSVILDVSEAQLNGNVNTTSGVSTFKDVELSGRIGIGTTASSNPVSVNELIVDRFMVDSNGKVGVRTDSINTNMELDVNGDIQARHGLVVGPTTTPKCAIDMSGAVDIVADGSSRAPIAYMIPPRLTTAQRNALTDTAGNALSSDEAGATIYNTQTNKLQVWNGTTWNDCF